MPTFLVESYSPADRAAEAEAALTRLAASHQGLRHLRTTFIPEDETCLHFVEGTSRAAVRAALDRAAISYDRITDVAERPGGSLGVPTGRAGGGER